MDSPDVQALRDEKYNATLVWMREANPDLRIMRIKPDFPVPEHAAGQYTTLGLGDWEPRARGCQPEDPWDQAKPRLIRRAYSISSSVLDEDGALLNHKEADWLEFYIVLVRDSGGEKPPALTPRLFLLQENDRLFLGKKIAGHFTAEDVQPNDSVVFLSTGTGEAPHNYITWELLTKGHQGKIVSACCVRYGRDLGYLAVHETLMKRYEQYKYIALTTRDADVKKKVYIQELLSSGELERQGNTQLSPESTHVFLCGNPKMIGVPAVDRKTGDKQYPTPLGVVEILEQRGFQIDQPSKKIRGNIHFEEYW